MKPHPPHRCSKAPRLSTLLALLALCAAPVFAQTAMPKQPAPKTPDMPGSATPSDPGAVVTPPRTGTEEMVKTPGNVDPKIDDATPDIDRKNREKSADKKAQEKKKRND